MPTDNSRKLSSVREMEGIGLSVGEVNKKNLASRRVKKGECPTCGTPTHRVGFLGKKKPLCIEGQSFYGRCLLCNPLNAGGNHQGTVTRQAEATESTHLSQTFVPRTLELEDRYRDANDDDDDVTMVSGITMDHRLIIGARNWTGEENRLEEEYDTLTGAFELVPTIPGAGRRRPDASLCGDDAPLRRPPGRDGSMYASSVPPPQPKRYVSAHEMRMDAIGSELNFSLDADSLTRSSQTRPRSGRKSSISRPPQIPTMDYALSEQSISWDRRGLPKGLNKKIIEDENSGPTIQSSDSFRQRQTLSRAGKTPSVSRLTQLAAERIPEHSIAEQLNSQNRSPSLKRNGSSKPLNKKFMEEEKSASTKYTGISCSTGQRDILFHAFHPTADTTYSDCSGEPRPSLHVQDQSLLGSATSEGNSGEGVWNDSKEYAVGVSQDLTAGITHVDVNYAFSSSTALTKNDFIPRDNRFRVAPTSSSPKNSVGVLDDENDEDDDSVFLKIRVPERTTKPDKSGALPLYVQKSQSGFQPSDSGLQAAPNFVSRHSGVQKTDEGLKPLLNSEYVSSVQFSPSVVDDSGPDRQSQHKVKLLQDSFEIDRYHLPVIGFTSSEQYDPGEDEFIVLDKVQKERFSEGDRHKDPYLDQTVSQQPEPSTASTLLDQNDFRSNLGLTDSRNRQSGSDSDKWHDRNKRGMPDGDGNPISPVNPGRSLGHQGMHIPALTEDIPDKSEMPFRKGPLQDPIIPSEGLYSVIEAKGTQENYMQIAPTATHLNVQNILVILNSLDQANEKQRENAFRNLSHIVFLNGHKAKIDSNQYYAPKMLVEFMWSDMSNPEVLAACCQFFFALAASTDGEARSDVLTEVNAEGAIDALLISMQSHSSMESIQRSGIGTLCCLAQASSNNPEINDGTLSGAVVCVTNAMDTHHASASVQEWGIRALYSQCIQSVNAESNKSSLAKSGNDGGSGLEVVARAMETLRNDQVSLEWACQLYWCLSTSVDMVGSLSSSPVHVLAIMNTVRMFSKRSSTAALMEASFGALANFSRNDQLSAVIVDAGIVSILIDSMRHYSDDEGVNVEACTLLSNLAQNARNKDELIQYDGIDILLRVIRGFPRNSELQEEAVIALLCLTIASEDGKIAMTTESTFSLLVEILSDVNASTNLHELVCSVLGSLCTLGGPAQFAATTTGMIDSILLTMKMRPKERKLIEAATLLLRNLSCHEASLHVLLGNDVIQAVCSAMNSVSDSESVQVNGCCTLWSICARDNQRPINNTGDEAIEQIVKSMQLHMGSAQVLEMACGALWSLVDNCDERKCLVVGCSGIDAVTCALILHPQETKTLETACGVLSNISVRTELASAVTDSQKDIISIIVEAMRTNASSMCLLEFGTLVLRNIILTNPQSASEASNGISTIINGMKNHRDALSFNIEACNALWAMAAQSEDCKTKILDLDGVAILMGALAHNSASDVQDAARGAIDSICWTYGETQ